MAARALRRGGASAEADGHEDVDEADGGADDTSPGVIRSTVSFVYVLMPIRLS